MFLTPGRCVSTLLAGKRAISTEPSTLKIKYILLFGVQQAFIGSSPSVHKKITFSQHMKSFFFREFSFGEKGLGFFSDHMDLCMIKQAHEISGTVSSDPSVPILQL